MLTASAASARTRRRNAASAPRSRTGQSRTERLTAAAMLAPSAVGVGLFLVAPIAVVVAVSLTDWNLITRPSFTGLENYASLLADSGFLSSLVVTALFSLMAIPATVAVGFLIALGLNRNLPGSSLMRLLYVLPWVCAPLTLGIVWKWLLNPSRGLIDGVLGQRVEWMSDPALALPTVAFVYVWQNVGYVSLFFLAGLQGIPASVIEAARLDGAGPVRLAWRMYLPLLRPTTFFVLVTSLISSFQAFDLVYGLTGGNPGYPGGTTNVVAAQIYSTAFGSGNDVGRASAMAVVLLVFVAAVTAAQQRYFAKRTVYEIA